MNSYLKTSPHYPVDNRQWENDIHSLIHSGYFYSASSSPLLLRGTPESRPQQLTLRLSPHAKALQAAVIEVLVPGVAA